MLLFIRSMSVSTPSVLTPQSPPNPRRAWDSPTRSRLHRCFISNRKFTMTQPVPQSTERRAFLDARFVRARLVSEKTGSAPTRFAKEPEQLRLKVDVNTSLSVGVNDPMSPTEL